MKYKFVLKYYDMIKYEWLSTITKKKKKKLPYFYYDSGVNLFLRFNVYL